MNQITFASRNKQSEPLFHWLARMCTFLTPTKPVQVCWRGPGASFRPLSHKIPFCAARGRESTRAWASATEPHQGHTNITSVQLLWLHRCISCVMKLCAESTGQRAVLNPDACWTGRTFILQVRKLNLDCHL